jgi:hypothetical protein
VSEHLRSSAGS